MKFVRLRVLTNSRLGVRGSALLTLGIFHCVYSIQQLFPDPLWLDRGDVSWRTAHLHTASEVMGLVWVVVGVTCIASAFMRADGLGFGGTAALFGFWAFTEIGAWLDHQAPRGYLSAATWGAFGVLTLILSRIEERPKIVSYRAAEEQITAVEALTDEEDDL